MKTLLLLLALAATTSAQTATTYFYGDYAVTEVTEPKPYDIRDWLARQKIEMDARYQQMRDQNDAWRALMAQRNLEWEARKQTRILEEIRDKR